MTSYDIIMTSFGIDLLLCWQMQQRVAVTNITMTTVAATTATAPAIMGSSGPPGGKGEGVT